MDRRECIQLAMAGAVGGTLGPRTSIGTWIFLISSWPGRSTIYLCSELDGTSRYLVHGEIRTSMKEAKVETIVERAREKFPQASPQILPDNGPQFIRLTVYALAAILKKQLRLGLHHYKILPILRVTVFEKLLILEEFSNFTNRLSEAGACIQLIHFDL